MKLTYRRNGDYLLPDLGLPEAEQRPVGKYGRMRLRYLEEHRPGLYTRFFSPANSRNTCRKSTELVKSGWSS